MRIDPHSNRAADRETLRAASLGFALPGRRVIFLVAGVPFSGVRVSFFEARLDFFALFFSVCHADTSL